MKFKPCFQAAAVLLVLAVHHAKALAEVADSELASQELSAIHRLKRRSVSAAVSNRQDAMNHLKKYNHMSSSGSEGDMQEALMSYQTMAGINATGIMDDETMAMMNKPRCGVYDNMGMNNAMRRRRYDAIIRWPEDNITWRVNSFTNDLSQNDVIQTLRKAFDIWAKYSGLVFIQVTDRNKDVDFDIEFKRREHGDHGSNQGLIFDGPGHVLAHAFFPSGNPVPAGLPGDIHFDLDESYTLNSRHGINFFQLALHEIGHSLGLGHSGIKDAVMSAFGKPYDPKYTLHPDDIAGIRYLYGQGDKKPDYTMAPAPGNPRCPDGIDAMVGTDDGWIFAFSRRYVWRLDKNGIVRGWPKLIRDAFPGLENDIDAAIFFKGEFHFFKGRHVFIFTITFKFVGRFDIKKKWKGVPDNIDAAFHWSGNGKIYFIKGSKYWRYSTHWKKVYHGYPYGLHKWNLGFDKVDAVLQWEDSPTYFFTGNDYYKYDDHHEKPAAGYPRRTDQWWFGCGYSNLVQGGGNGAVTSVVPSVGLMALIVIRSIMFLF